MYYSFPIYILPGKKLNWLISKALTTTNLKTLSRVFAHFLAEDRIKSVFIPSVFVKHNLLLAGFRCTDSGPSISAL